MLIVLVTGSTEPACMVCVIQEFSKLMIKFKTQENKAKTIKINNRVWQRIKVTSLNTTLCKDCTEQLDQ